MNILALDLAHKVGFAYRKDGKLSLGSTTFGSSLGGSNGARWMEFTMWLEATCSEGQFELIAFENVVNNSKVPGRMRTGQVYGGYLSVLELFAFRNRLALEPFGISTIKTFATGIAGADKVRMIEAAQNAILVEAKAGNIRGVGSIDDNAADAYWILRLAEATVRGERRIAPTGSKRRSSQ